MTCYAECIVPRGDTSFLVADRATRRVAQAFILDLWLPQGGICLLQ